MRLTLTEIYNDEINIHTTEIKKCPAEFNKRGHTSLEDNPHIRVRKRQ